MLKLRNSAPGSVVLSLILFAFGLVLFSQCVAGPASDNAGEGGEGGGNEGGEGGGGEGGASNEGGEGGGGEGGASNEGGEGGGSEGGAGGGEGGGSEGGAGGGGEGGGSEGGAGGGSEGGSGGTQSQGGSGGTASAMDPCPESGNCRILCLGDGIAQGMPGTQGGYRARIFEVLSARQYRFEFVGSKSVQSPRPQTRPHEGTPDERSDQLLGKLPGILTSTNPHIIILNIGAEDVEQNYMLSGFRNRLAQILTTIRTSKPNTLIIVSHPNPTTNNTFNTRLMTLETQLAAEVDSRRNAGDTLLLRAPLRSSFALPYQPNSVNSQYLSGTKYYPSAMGYTVLGNVYIGHFQRFLKR